MPFTGAAARRFVLAGDDGGMTEPRDGGQDARVTRRRARKLSEVFGEVLPETTSDDRTSGTDEDDRERWYRENLPPHHG